MNISKINDALDFAIRNIPQHYELIKEALESKKNKELHKKFTGFRTLKEENIKLKRKYEELEARATKCTPSYSENSGNGTFDEGKVALAGEMAQLKTELEKNIELTNGEIAEIENCLSKIDDTEVREIVRLKFEEGLTWNQVAFRLGWYDESKARKKYNRWLNKGDF